MQAAPPLTTQQSLAFSCLQELEESCIVYTCNDAEIYKQIKGAKLTNVSTDGASVVQEISPVSCWAQAHSYNPLKACLPAYALGTLCTTMSCTRSSQTHLKGGAISPSLQEESLCVPAY